MHDAPYSIVGPGRFRVHFAIDPNYRRDYFNRSERLHNVTTHESCRETRRTELVNGQPMPADARWDFAIGKPFSSDVAWSVPAGPFKGTIELCSPVNCNLASCDRRAATAALKVDFGRGADAPASNEAARVTGTWSWFVNGDVTFQADGTLTQVSHSVRWTRSGSVVKIAWSHGDFGSLTL